MLGQHLRVGPETAAGIGPDEEGDVLAAIGIREGISLCGHRDMGEDEAGEGQHGQF